ncbi:MAG: hypothetical protein RBR66_02945 [Candidatus Izemoplasmatales bacterium]|jgi:hypothetical protein|nr:hypothetical protein [Candidatus Izemoplasmatales bacterium]
MKQKNDIMIRVYTEGNCPEEYWQRKYIDKINGCNQNNNGGNFYEKL